MTRSTAGSSTRATTGCSSPPPRRTSVARSSYGSSSRPLLGEQVAFCDQLQLDVVEIAKHEHHGALQRVGRHGSRVVHLLCEQSHLPVVKLADVVHSEGEVVESGAGLVEALPAVRGVLAETESHGECVVAKEHLAPRAVGTRELTYPDEAEHC